MNRPPDINLDEQTTPNEHSLIEGIRLMLTARSAKIPYGLATRRDSYNKPKTVGIIIETNNKPAMMHALSIKRTNPV